MALNLVQWFILKDLFEESSEWITKPVLILQPNDSNQITNHSKEIMHFNITQPHTHIFNNNHPATTTPAAVRTTVL